MVKSNKFTNNLHIVFTWIFEGGDKLRKWLKDLRAKNKLTQQDMAKKLSIAQQYYSCIEKGERQKDLNLSIVKKISGIFGVSIEWIAEQEGKPSPSAAQPPLPK